MLLKHLIKFLLILASLSFVSGCSTKPDINEADRINNSIYANNLLSNINSDIKLSQTEALHSLTRSANSVSNSLLKIAEIEQATHPAAILKPGPVAAKIGMANLVSIDWNGPAEPLLNRLVKNCGYKLNTLGTPPTIPLLISVNSKEQSVASVIRNIGFQIQKNADIQIFPTRKIVELRYS